MTRAFYIALIALFTLPGCIRGKKDTTYTFSCTTSCKTDSFTLIVTDTTLINYTDGEANLYVRAHSDSHCTTDCQR